MDASYVKDFSKFGDNNENDEIRSPKLHKHKKAVTKHFMEPTISAATKAALLPKRKILAERNEAFTFTNSSKPPILDSRTSPARSVRSSCSSHHDDGEDEENRFDGNSSSKKPYDPLTNYLSPRPKFLRYNPNKKQRIFLHGDSGSEITEKKDGLGVVSTTSSFESQKVVEEKTFEEGFVKQEDVEEGKPNDLDDEDAEMEEDIEEFDENDDDDEEEEEKEWSVLGLMKLLFVLGSLFLSTTYICSMNSRDHTLIEEDVRDFRHGFLNQSNTEEVVTRNEHLANEFEVLGGKEEEPRISLPDITQDDIDVELVEGGVSEVSNDDKELLASTAKLQIEKPEDVYGDGLMSKMEACDALQWAEATESETSSDVAEASSDQLSQNLIVRDQEMWGIQDGIEQLQPETVEVKNLFSETEASPDNYAEFEQMKSEEMRSQVEVAGLVVLFTMVPALCLLYHSLRRNSKEASLPTHKKDSFEEASLPTHKKDSFEEASLPIETHQPNAEPAHQIQSTTAICSVEEEYVEKVASFTSPSTPLASMNVVSKEVSSQRQAPIVELLGELVIGEETFVRSSKMTRMPDPEERNASNSLSTQMMKSRSKTCFVENHPIHLDLSTADSASQKKNRPVKEESNGGEVSMSTMTPVRRSSRLRNKAMSP
ncbi:hypothetical protein POM88_044691 [Heracleum sosnowskyi]|uniref:Uncharacterized protein n=1 Tax=Heracleum sosnowskyi TaxID=360622 RepID=A0AAD8H386_9APIA|nr:hypothetical protein POM88_044691 [Heracleum sosnowskyi]